MIVQTVQIEMRVAMVLSFTPVRKKQSHRHHLQKKLNKFNQKSFLDQDRS